MENLDLSIESFINKLEKLSTTVLWDRSYGNAFILKEPLINYKKDKVLAGPVFLVEVDNNILPIIQALDKIQEKYVLVIKNNVKNGEALLGDIIMSAAQNQNLSGIVVFGKIRDIDSVDQFDISIWAQGLSIKPAKLGEACTSFPDQLNLENGVLHKDDWLVGDGDGLIAIKKNKLRLVLKAAQFKNKRENIYIKRLNEGERISDMMNVENYVAGKGDIVVDF